MTGPMKKWPPCWDNSSWFYCSLIFGFGMALISFLSR